MKKIVDVLMFLEERQSECVVLLLLLMIVIGELYDESFIVLTSAVSLAILCYGADREYRSVRDMYDEK